MVISKNEAIDTALNNFLKQGFLGHFGPEIFANWLQNCDYFAARKMLIIQVSSQHTADFINSNLLEDITIFCNASWPNCGIKPVACVDVNDAQRLQNDLQKQDFSGVDNIVSIDQNKGHSFDDFVVGNENQVVYDLLCGIAGKGKKVLDSGSLVYLTGAVGVGKTHLLKSAESYAKSAKRKNVCYLSAEVFSSKYITAIKENTLFDMRNSILGYDALLIDDIGFICHRKSTMEELGSIVSIMLDSGKDVVITTTSDVSAFKDNKRLYNRLLSSVVVNAPKPSSELKKNVAISYIKKCNLEVSEDVIAFLATNITGGIRELKGAIDRIRINISVLSTISIPVIKNLLSDMLIVCEETANYANDIEMVIGKVADYYQISISDIRNPRNSNNNKLARSVAIYLCREICGLVYAKIAKEFGLTTHAGIMHSIAKLKTVMQDDSKLINDIDFITESIRRALGA